MHAIIERTTDGKVWTGEEWISTNVTGWRDAAAFEDHDAALGQLESQLETDRADEFETARVIDVD